MTIIKPISHDNNVLLTCHYMLLSCNRLDNFRITGSNALVGKVVIYLSYMRINSQYFTGKWI